jgi:hypothetical protein
VFRDRLCDRRQNVPGDGGFAVIGDKPRQIATGSPQIQSSLPSVSDFHCRFECATGLIMTILPQKYVPGEPFQLGKREGVAVSLGGVDPVQDSLFRAIKIANA